MLSCNSKGFKQRTFAVKNMAIGHLIKNLSAQRQKFQLTGRQSNTLNTNLASLICFEKPRLESDVMAIDIINANYALLSEDRVSRPCVHC